MKEIKDIANSTGISKKKIKKEFDFAKKINNPILKLVKVKYSQKNRGRRMTIKRICGIDKEIFYDSKYKKIYVELVIKNDVPILQILEYETDKVILELHITEAIELKSIIDTLCFDYLWNIGE